MFTCPNTKDKVSFIDEIDSNTSYILLTPPISENNPDTVLGYDKSGNHEDYHHELFINGHVKWKRDLP